MRTTITEVVNHIYEETLKKHGDKEEWKQREEFNKEMSLYTTVEMKIINEYVRKGVELRGLSHEIIPDRAYRLYNRYKKIYCKE